MNRKIFYVDCYYKEEKEGNIGFVKLEDDGMFMMFRGIPASGKSVCRVYAVIKGKDKKLLCDVSLQNGYGQAKFQWTRTFGMLDCKELFISIDAKRYGICSMEMQSMKQIKTTNIQKFPQKQENKVSALKEDVWKKENKKIPIIETIQESMPVMEQDKWKQLCKNYPQVHIFPEADTIVMKPKDMIILTQDYHELATNSFVLHAYYNYRQLLLLRYHQRTEATYYLGVPGVYYEREKRIALMFGFEGFENGESRLVNEDRRQAYAGCFGYYMKQVNI